jgi:8-amino-7-oxononanoate synthase
MTRRDWDSFLSSSLDEKRAIDQFRTRGAGRFGQGAISPSFDFGSNDYLGLSTHPRIVESLRASARCGSGASPVLSGYGDEHHRLESALARLAGTEASLVFSSGYAANVGTLACLASDGDLILSDRLNHASLIDGCRLSNAQTKVYPHADEGFVREFLGLHRENFRRVLIVTESIFSMDGDCAPLRELSELAERFECGLVVDEAHATGVRGNRGAGMLEELGLEDQVLAKLGTLSKAIGCVGGYVCGSRQLIDYLVNHCRSYIFSTAPASAIMLAAQAAIDQMGSMDVERSRLKQLAGKLRADLRRLGWYVPQSNVGCGCDDSCIVPVIVGDERTTLELSQRLANDGIYVPAIRPPTVPAGTSRLRISLTARHSQESLTALLDSMGEPRESSAER